MALTITKQSGIYEIDGVLNSQNISAIKNYFELIIEKSAYIKMSLNKIIDLEKLQELDNKLLWQNNEIKKYYSELTEIVRVFIEKELEIPALEITTHELVSLLSDYNNPKNIKPAKETIRKLNALLQEADLVKFAKSTPLSHEIEEDRRDAEKVLNDLKPIPLIEEIKENELE